MLTNLTDRVARCVSGKTVLITGGAGSIGSALAARLARYDVKALRLLDHDEEAAFYLNLAYRGHDKVRVLLGDVRDRNRMVRALQGVDIVVHAAALKHVEMGEYNPFEVVSTNLSALQSLIEIALDLEVERFVFTSSDKAVNPTNIMGLTKRVAELIVSSLPTPAEGATTKCVSVRFGNVLGSNGSVVPLFRQQIAAGGPVTVTHPEMRRYFMTIREAVQLVLQASTMGKGSEIFVLDMGEPVSIVSLARNMIRLSGHEPDVDIEIRFTGLRPGEKLFEELALEGEDHVPTYHQKIKIFRGSRNDAAAMDVWIAELERLAAEGAEAAIIAHLKSLVPEYTPMGRWRRVLEGAAAPELPVAR